MTAADVTWCVDLLDQRGVGCWIDGGWGVDALLGRQTRPHGDLDLVVEARHETTVVAALREHRFEERQTDYSTPYHSVWRDGAGREVDLHLIVLNDRGDGEFGPDDVYPAEALTGLGVVGGRPVRCLTADAQVRFHVGYDHDEDDLADVRALCEAFDLAVPEQYRA